MAGGAVGSQMTSINKPPIQRNASNTRIGSVQSKRLGANKMALMDETKSDFGNNHNLGDMRGLNINTQSMQGMGLDGAAATRLGYTDNVHPASNRNALREAGKS